MDTDTEEDVPMKTAAARSPKGHRPSPKSRDRAGVKTLDLRRPVRPVDREKMRPWLKNHLDSGTVFGLKWLNKEEGTFQVSWRHASRLGWKLETDGDVFEKWARHTGIFKDGDEPEPKRWKANFRCAIHSLPDVRELTDPVERRGHNANRTYRFLQPDEIGTQVKRKSIPVQPPVCPQPKQHYEAEEQTVVEDSEDSSTRSPQMDSDNKIEDEDGGAQYREIYVLPQSDHDYAVRIGRKDGEESSVTKILSEHGSGFVLIKTKKPSSLPTTLVDALDISQSLEQRRVVQKSADTSSKVNLKAVKKVSPVYRGKGRLSMNTGTLVAGKKATGAKPLRQGTADARQMGTGKGNTFSLLSGNRVNPAEGGTGSPQTLGFDALLAAANMARMDTLSSATASTTASVALTNWAPSVVSACPPVSAVSYSASNTAYTVHQEFPTAVRSFSSGVTQPVHTEAESRVIQIHTEKTEEAFPSQTALSSAQSTFVINILQNLLGSSPVSAVMTPEVSLAPSSVQSSFSGDVQVKDSPPLSSITPTVQHDSNTTGVALSSESIHLGSSVLEGSRLKALLHQVGNQTVSTVPCAATMAASGLSTSSAIGMTSVTSSSELHSDRTGIPSVLEIKMEPSDPVVADIKNWTEIGHMESPGVKKFEQVGLDADTTFKEEKDHSLNTPEDKQYGKIGSTISLPAASMVHTKFSTPTYHHSDLCQSDSVQAAVSHMKRSSESSVPGANANISQAVSVASHSASSSSKVQKSGLQVSATSLPQTFNMGPVFVVNPSIVLTLPQTSTSASQIENSSVVTLPISDLQDFLNMCFAGGAHQVLQSAEPVPANSAHIPDSTVNDCVLMATTEAGQGGKTVSLSSTGVDSSAHMTVSASGGEHELPTASISQGTSYMSVKTKPGKTEN